MPKWQYWLWTFKFIDVKAECAEEGTFFTNRFPSLRTFVNKKVGIWKNQAQHSIRPSTTDIIKVVLVFLILSTKILREGNLFVKKVPTTANSALVGKVNVPNFHNLLLTENLNLCWILQIIRKSLTFFWQCIQQKNLHCKSYWKFRTLILLLHMYSSYVVLYVFNNAITK